MAAEPHIDVTSRADALRREADAVLENSAILSTLSTMGRVELVGSYVLGLMVRPDIDIVVTADQPQRTVAVDTTKQILDAGYFQSVVFIDHLTFQQRLDASMDAQGFCWHLDVPELSFGKQWKVDVWYLKPAENCFRDRTDAFHDALAADPTARETILDLKTRFLCGRGYTHGLG